MPSHRPRLRRIEPILRRALRGPCALPPGSRVLVAVSGGADSTALLVALDRVAHEFGLALHAAHLHHGLRGDDADRDHAFVLDLCDRLSVPVSSARWNTRARMKRRGLSGQAGLRTLRREYLAQVARRVGARAIATAHTADDQLETLLLRLLRGAGLEGLGGMSQRRGLWIKPLLGATRADIEADLAATGQGWREDLSNLDRSYARARVRHDVVPALVAALGASGRDAPRARKALARRASEATAELRQVRRLIERMASGLLAKAGRPVLGIEAARAREIHLDSARLRSYPQAVRPTLFRILWRRLGHGQPGLTHRHLAALLALVRSDREGARLDLPAGWSAHREHGCLILRSGTAISTGVRSGRTHCRTRASLRAGVTGRPTR